MSRVFRGHVFHVAGSPAQVDAASHLVSLPDGAVVVDESGLVAWVGRFDALPGPYAEHQVVRAGFVLPGFVDTHLHFPQTFTTDAYGGGQLLEWLDRCVFPSEARLADETYALALARAFTARRVSVGTTAALVVGSAFEHAQDALFAASRDAGVRLVSGRGIQTVGPPSARALLTSDADALRLVADEIARWHGADTARRHGADTQGTRVKSSTALLQVAVVPRFALSVTPRVLADLGELYDSVRGDGVYFHSHLNENNRPGDGEIDIVRAAFGVDSYLDTYDGRFLPGSAVGGSSLLGRRSILAHGVHCTDAELARLADTQTSIAHCPTSQQFLGSGTMPWRRTLSAGVTVAIGSDVGGGDEWLIPRVLNDCYKVHLSEPGGAGVALHPAELLFAATLAGARALDQEEQFGNFDVGKEADLVLVDPQRWEPLALALENGIRDDDPELATVQTLFTLLMGVREPAITGVYVRGRRVQAR